MISRLAHALQQWKVSLGDEGGHWSVFAAFLGVETARGKKLN